ncbi:MAG: hypothetical protein M1453_00570 [Acidobacteria bacterium]|nr:hypothetical protein [Acidobacteriota bacterium]
MTAAAPGTRMNVALPTGLAALLQRLSAFPEALHTKPRQCWNGFRNQVSGFREFPIFD